MLQVYLNCSGFHVFYRMFENDSKGTEFRKCTKSITSDRIRILEDILLNSAPKTHFSAYCTNTIREFRQWVSHPIYCGSFYEAVLQSLKDSQSDTREQYLASSERDKNDRDESISEHCNKEPNLRIEAKSFSYLRSYCQSLTLSIEEGREYALHTSLCNVLTLLTWALDIQHPPTRQIKVLWEFSTFLRHFAEEAACSQSGDFLSIINLFRSNVESYMRNLTPLSLLVCIETHCLDLIGKQKRSSPIRWSIVSGSLSLNDKSKPLESKISKESCENLTEKGIEYSATQYECDMGITSPKDRIKPLTETPQSISQVVENECTRLHAALHSENKIHVLLREWETICLQKLREDADSSYFTVFLNAGLRLYLLSKEELSVVLRDVRNIVCDIVHLVCTDLKFVKVMTSAQWHNISVCLIMLFTPLHLPEQLRGDLTECDVIGIWNYEIVLRLLRQLNRA